VCVCVLMHEVVYGRKSRRIRVVGCARMSVAVRIDGQEVLLTDFLDG
jgi:hypothetical protein